ncbi:MAG: amidohydrolase family protein [Chthoniobacterales bacterium]
MKKYFLNVFCASAVACLFSMGSAFAGSADLVVIGNIRTMDKKMPVAEALAVETGKIVYVGDVKGARERLSAKGKVIQLGPKEMLLPGFIDSHVHPFLAGMKAQGLVIDQPESKEALLASISAYAKAHRDLKWIIGNGWPPTISPTLEELDAVTDGRPAPSTVRMRIRRG